eukprot:TRINITY_DN5217_c0_g3_i1.p1 TRINITY_DN5217_c0_g3~~TRINITY_DN5217_c0_g3_i1.p1  ORF type:complete len:539 (+),score=121.08 TRINITY_DN5217_c0_g3_i1:947-2563(+)
MYPQSRSKDSTNMLKIAKSVSQCSGMKRLSTKKEPATMAMSRNTRPAPAGAMLFKVCGTATLGKLSLSWSRGWAGLQIALQLGCVGYLVRVGYLLLDLSLFHDVDAIGQPADHRKVLLNDDGGDPFLHLAQDAKDLGDDYGGQALGGLVHQQHAGLAHQGAPDQQDLALPAGEPPGLAVQKLFELGVEPQEPLHRGLQPFARGVGGQLQIVAHGQIAEDLLVLGHEAQAQAGHLVGPEAQQRLALKGDGALAGRQESGDGFEQGGLACPVAPHHEHHLPALQVYRDPVQRLGVAVGNIYVLHLQHVVLSSAPQQHSRTSGLHSTSSGVPSQISTPSFITLRRLTKSTILEILCSMITRLRSFLTSWSRSMTWAISWSLSPARGSSSSSSRGLSDRAMAISSMRLSPQESSAVLAPRDSAIPTFSKDSAQDSKSLLRRAGRRQKPEKPALWRSRKRRLDSTRFCHTVRESKTETSWKVRAMPMPTRAWGGSWVTSCPPKDTAPPLGGKQPESRLNKVVLPEPLGPITPATCPSSKLKFT